MKLIEFFLIEYNEARIINDFGKNLAAHYSKEFLTFDVYDQIATPNSKPEDLAEIVVREIASKDPTPNKEFTFWLAMTYARPIPNYGQNGYGIKRFEDIESRAIPALLKFKALLRKPNLNPPLPIRDVNQLKTLMELEDIIRKYPDEASQSNSKADAKTEQDFYNTEQAKLLLNDKDLKVVMFNSMNASKFFGRGTKWCTAAEKGNMFNNYNRPNDRLFVIMVKGTSEKYQFHFGSDQFMDAQDEEIEPMFLFRRFPQLISCFDARWNQHGDNIFEQMARSGNVEIRYIVAEYNETPEEILELMVKENGQQAVLQAIALNSGATTKVLSLLFHKVMTNEGEFLSSQAVEGIIINIINNPNSSENMFMKLAKGPNEYFKLLLARRGRFPKILKLLAKDSAPGTRTYIVSNPNTPLEVLKDMKENDPLYSIRSDAEYKYFYRAQKINGQNS